MSETNWAGNLKYSATEFVSPRSIDELVHEVRSHQRIKACGSRHSFSSLGDTSGCLVSLAHLCNVEVAADRKAVTVRGDTRYGDLCSNLKSWNLALANLASLPHISVIGACATGTHGSGLRVGNLATQVSAVTLMTGAGEVLKYSKGDPQFNGVVVNLGALGVVVEAVLDVEPEYLVAQKVYTDLPLGAALENFDAISQLGYSVSLFTEWKSETIDQVWVKRRGPGFSGVTVNDEGGGVPIAEPLDEWPDDLFGAQPSTSKLHPIRRMPGDNCTDQLGVPGCWYERLPHFKMGFTPSAGDELQSEYFVPLAKAQEAIRAISKLRKSIAPLLQVSEIRFIAKDDLWMSPASNRDSVGLHFTWLKDQPGVEAILPEVEAALEPFEARPHFGKLFTMGHQNISRVYPRFGDFANLVAALDPNQKFMNPFLGKLFGF